MRVPDSAAAFIRQPGGTLLVEGVWDTPQHQAASATIVGALQYLARASGSDVRLAEDATGADSLPSSRKVRIVPTGQSAQLGPDGLSIQLPLS